VDTEQLPPARKLRIRRNIATDSKIDIDGAGAISVETPTFPVNLMKRRVFTPGSPGSTQPLKILHRKPTLSKAKSFHILKDSTGR
jgi:hypothetical protein